MQEITWTVSNPDGSSVETGKVKQLPHYEEVTIDESMKGGTLEFAKRYNAMRGALLENGLMKKK